MRTSDEITVSMIHIPTWENELRVVEITSPILIEEWLHKSAHPGNWVEAPYDSVIVGGRYDGGHVIMVHDNDEGEHVYVRPPARGDPLAAGAAAGRPIQHARGAYAGTDRLMPPGCSAPHRLVYCKLTAIGA